MDPSAPRFATVTRAHRTSAREGSSDPLPGTLTFRIIDSDLARFDDIDPDAREDLAVWFEDLVYAMPLWALMVVAFVPAAITAVMMHPLSYLLDASENTEKLRSSLSALVGTAFVFLVSLSTNTLWRDTSTLTGAVTDLAVQERDLYLVLRQTAPEDAEKLLELVDTHNRLILDRELFDGALAGNEEIDQVLVEINNLVDSLPADLPELDQVKSDFEEFLISRDDYLSSLNFPGLPDVVWFAVITLGMFFVALLALQRRGKSRRFAGMAIAGVVFAVGLIQLPMWTLSSFWMIRHMTEDSLIDAVQPAGGPGAVYTGQVIAAIAMLAFLLIVVVLAWRWERQDSQIKQEEEAVDEELVDAEIVQEQLRDVLTDIRDELREDRESRAEQPASSKAQGPPAND
jgi:putative NADPH-quinone reductase/uncharacterized membrane protein